MTLPLPRALMATTPQPSGFFLPTDLGERDLLMREGCLMQGESVKNRKG